MEKITKIIDRLPTTPLSVVSERQSSENAQPNPSSEKRRLIQNLWTSMGALYGHRWASSYGAEVDPCRVWEASLNDVTEAQIKAGLRACVEQRLEWPPTAPQFRELCKPKQIENAAMYKPLQPLLEKTTFSERQAHARIGLQVARNILNGNGGVQK